jgi:hypothetical protein
MLLRNDMIGLVGQEGVVFREQAVLALQRCTFPDKTTERRGHLWGRHVASRRARALTNCMRRSISSIGQARPAHRR